MAQYFGHKSRFGRYLTWKYNGLFFLVLIVLGAISYFALKFQTTSWLVVGGLFLMVRFFISMADIFEKRSGKVWRGNGGESAIRYLLKKLPDDYTYFEDVVCGRGNIDFVVVGPNGVFAVEAKSHGGSLSYSNGQLVNYGRPFQKNFLHQVWGEKKSLEEFLKQNNISEFVTPILVFTKAYMKFGYTPIEGVVTINKSYLNEFIEHHSHFVKEPEKIIEVIKTLYSK